MNIDMEKLEAARQKIAEGISEYFSVHYPERDQMIGDWALIAHCPFIEDPGNENYMTIYHSYHTPSHVACGLFIQGEEIASGGGSWKFTEEDDPE